MSIIKVCLKCKEYIQLFDTFDSKEVEHEFLKDHRTHPTITASIREIAMKKSKLGYKNCTKKYLQMHAV